MVRQVPCPLHFVAPHVANQNSISHGRGGMIKTTNTYILDNKGPKSRESKRIFPTASNIGHQRRDI
jgi:hypothetical protein